MIALELTELKARPESAERLAAKIRKLDPFQPKPGWHRPYYTGEAHVEVETAFAGTFGYEDCPAAPLSQPELPNAENE